MKNTLLLPRSFRPAGLVLLVPSIALLIAYFHYDFLFSFLDTNWQNNLTGKLADNFTGGNNNLTDEIAIGATIISLFMIAFSRQKHEDEYVSYIRLRSLQIGVYTSYASFLLLTFTVYGGNYIAVVFYNIFVSLILFIVVFYYNILIKPMFAKTAEA
jgi:hypothetical protein